METKYKVKETLMLNRDLKIRLLRAVEKGEININDFPEFTALIEPVHKTIIGMRIIDSRRGNDLF